MKRRDFLTLSIKSAMAAGFTSAIPLALLRPNSSHAAILAAGLSDPAAQPLFANPVPNALAADFKYQFDANRELTVRMAEKTQQTGLVDASGRALNTRIWGYGDGQGVSWPGPTLELNVNDDPVRVKWLNKLPQEKKKGKGGKKCFSHLLPVDTNLHWAYSLPGYDIYSIEENGVPLVPHLHGGHNNSGSDGNPEFFFSPKFGVLGPRWESQWYDYGGPDWNQVAGMNWYHDHALGITRLNVYAGLAGFAAVRDAADTGLTDNPLGLPADPYELGFAVQDRMFRDTGELFYPAFPSDPFYADFITGEGAILPPDLFPDGGPTALAEFFGDHMLVNGIIWPKQSVEPRQYRVRLLNGSDSRFMRLKLKVIDGGASNPSAVDPALGYELPFYLIGSDQSLRASAVQLNGVDFAPGERLDLVIDFKDVPAGSRVIVENLLGDAPFGGDLPSAVDLFPDRRTDRIMAFDVELQLSRNRKDTNVADGYGLGGGVGVPAADKVRKLALFEGMDEFGRLQPLLGTAEPVTDVAGNTVTGTLAWHAPITENPNLGDTEIWEIYNATGDAHPVHVHLVHFEVMNREGYSADVIPQPLLQHNGTFGNGFRLENIVTDGHVRARNAQEETRRDVVTALPGEVTRIKMTFDKPGRYVWHCHILSHEDHEMMRPYHVGPGPF